MLTFVDMNNRDILNDLMSSGRIYFNTEPELFDFFKDLRKNFFDMDLIDFDLNTLEVWTI